MTSQKQLELKFQTILNSLERKILTKNWTPSELKIIQAKLKALSKQLNSTIAKLKSTL